MMRRWRGAVAAIAVVSAVALVASGVPASADTTTPAQEALRTNVETLLAGLQGVVAQDQANPITAKGLTSTGTDPSAMIADAQQQIAQLDSAGLDALQAGLDQYPSWAQMPSTLSAAIASIKPSSTKLAQKNFSGTFTDDCDGAGSAPDLFTATEVANEVQSAAQALVLATPGVVALFFVDVPTGAKIAFAVIWGVANAVYLGLSQALAIATDCAQTAFSNTQNATWPVDPNNSSVNVRGSSEVSVQALITAAQGTQTEITNVLNTVDAVNTQADTLNTAATNLNTTLTDIDGRVAEVQTDLQTLRTNVNVLKNTEVQVLQKADQEIANLNEFQTLQVRMDIEENLTRGGAGTGPMGLYQLPVAKGGFLETVKSIVTDTITKETANGRGSAKANSDLATANSYFSTGKYKLAYGYYTKAYQDVR